jgi:hypothetical protein
MNYYYELLGLRIGASDAAIAAAYEHLKQRIDIRSDIDSIDRLLINLKIDEAFKILINPPTRANYHARLSDLRKAGKSVQRFTGRPIVDDIFLEYSKPSLLRRKDLIIYIGTNLELCQLVWCNAKLRSQYKVKNWVETIEMVPGLLAFQNPAFQAFCQLIKLEFMQHPDVNQFTQLISTIDFNVKEFKSYFSYRESILRLSKSGALMLVRDSSNRPSFFVELWQDLTARVKIQEWVWVALCQNNPDLALAIVDSGGYHQWESKSILSIACLNDYCCAMILRAGIGIDDFTGFDLLSFCNKFGEPVVKVIVENTLLINKMVKTISSDDDAANDYYLLGQYFLNCNKNSIAMAFFKKSVAENDYGSYIAMLSIQEQSTLEFCLQAIRKSIIKHGENQQLSDLLDIIQDKLFELTHENKYKSASRLDAELDDEKNAERQSLKYLDEKENEFILGICKGLYDTTQNSVMSFFNLSSPHYFSAPKKLSEVRNYIETNPSDVLARCLAIALQIVRFIRKDTGVNERIKLSGSATEELRTNSGIQKYISENHADFYAEATAQGLIPPKPAVAISAWNILRTGTR